MTEWCGKSDCGGAIAGIAIFALLVVLLVLRHVFDCRIEGREPAESLQGAALQNAARAALEQGQITAEEYAIATGSSPPRKEQ